jgi:hypothetical protein
MTACKGRLREKNKKEGAYNTKLTKHTKLKAVFPFAFLNVFVIFVHFVLKSL